MPAPFVPGSLYLGAPEHTGDRAAPPDRLLRPFAWLWVRMPLGSDRTRTARFPEALVRKAVGPEEPSHADAAALGAASVATQPVDARKSFNGLSHVCSPFCAFATERPLVYLL